MVEKYRIEEIGLVESDLKQVYYLACLTIACKLICVGVYVTINKVG